MDKIAVDLEKVLDDFEKEQSHTYSTGQSAISNSYGCNYSALTQHYRLPASNYRRPQFDPVNLSDADFSISAPTPLVQIQSNCLSSNNYPITNAYESHVVSKNDSASKTTNDETTALSYRSKEFKPDLIESNVDICTSLSEFDRFERHLPDIASADVEIKDEKVGFDLITNSVDTVVAESRAQEVIRFPVASNISDNELHQYLEELEEQEFSNSNDVSVADESASESLPPRCNNQNNGDKISIQVLCEASSQYMEKNEIEVQNDHSNTPFSTAEDISEEETERTTLSLNTSTGSVVTLEVFEDSPNSEENKTDTSVTEAMSSADETSTVNNCTEGGTSLEELITESETESNENGSLHDVDTDDYDSACFESGVATQYVEDKSRKVCEISEASVSDYRGNDKSDDDIIREEEISEEDIVISNNMIACKDNETDKLPTDNDVYINNNIDSSRIKGTPDNVVSTTDSNYHQVLDSKTAISRLEQVDDVVRPSTSQVEESTCCVDNEKAENICGMQIRVQRPDSLNLTHTTQNSEMSSTSADSGSLLSMGERKLGKEQPFWIPDSETTVCMQCNMKFTLVRRRHHCRACGLVLCSKCCDLKASLEYLGFEEARVCHSCHSIIEKVSNLEAEISSMKRPNPNNPMEYCSTIPPLLQVGPTQHAPPSVLVPVVGVLKREGRSKSNDTPKQVIFSDGIRPGGDLTELDMPSERRLPLRRRVTKRVGTPPGNPMQHRRMLNPETHSFIPSNNDLPAVVTKMQGEYVFSEIEKPLTVEDEPVKFAINYNLSVMVKRIILDCCVNRDVWCMTTDGLSCVGQDEIVFILEVLPAERYPPKDVFCIVNMLYQEASKGSTVTEMSFAAPYMNQLFGSKEHGGFVFIRHTYQCIQKLLLPRPPFLIALLIHRWETPWARLFPIRLILRLGAEYRYYPCPLVSIRDRPTLFTDIGHTIIGLLADFRKYSYSLPTVRGLMIHMEDRLTTILLPRNRYDQVVRALNNSEENVLAFAGNISSIADSHLVCMQSTQDDTSYHTQAINIHNKPRQVTGASFVVFNGSLKQCAWAGKSNIVEDGLMVQIPSENMSSLRSALRQMKDYSIGCGPQAEEVVVLKWAPDDVNFNVGVKSNIDNRPLSGVPSIRVHNGTDYSGALRLIRWTEVFILQSDEDSGNKTGDTVNISKLSESIARATCMALVPLLDLLATANLTTLAVRATIDPEKVEYEAGSCGEKLPPLYMKSLDEELIAVVHDAAVSIRDISSIVLELVFKVMEQG